MHEIQLNILRTFNEEIQTLAKKSGLTKKDPKTGSPLKPSFKAYEDQYNSTLGERPNILSVYEVSGDQLGLKGRSTQTFISGHRPLQARGAVQNSGTRLNAGLPNALETSFSVVNPDDQSTRTLFSAIRHGVYAPYKVKDPTQRMKMAADNMREMLLHLVEKYKGANGKKCPTEVPLSTTMLLTPFHMDFVRGAEAESTHLEESYLTTRMFANREIEVGGCKIIPRTTAMNFGSHTWKTENFSKSLKRAPGGVWTETHSVTRTSAYTTRRYQRERLRGI